MMIMFKEGKLLVKYIPHKGKASPNYFLFRLSFKVVSIVTTNVKCFVLAVHQIFAHHYAEKLLELRYSFRQVQKCALKGIKFSF